MQRRLFKRILLPALAFGLLAFFFYAFLPKPVPVDFAEVREAPMQMLVQAEGHTRIHDVYVVSAPVTGHLLRIEQHVGDEVIARESVLAQLLPSDPDFLDSRRRNQAEAMVRSATAALSLSRAERLKAGAEVKFAESEMQRARLMAERGSLSQADLDRVELALRTAHAAQAAARATEQMRAAELQNAQAVLAGPETGKADNGGIIKLISPVTGRILRLLQASETVIASGTPIMELGDPANMELVVDLLSRDAVQVRQGAAVVVTGWGGERPLQGRVRRVEPFGFTKVSALGIEEQRVNVIIDLTDPHEKWRQLGHGYRIEAAITLWESNSVLQVPTAALFREAGSWTVFTVKNGIARKTRITIGHNNGETAELIDGLAAGDTVVLHPSERISDGTTVESR